LVFGKLLFLEGAQVWEGAFGVIDDVLVVLLVVRARAVA
jgi:hypothetical protein